MDGMRDFLWWGAVWSPGDGPGHKNGADVDPPLFSGGMHHRKMGTSSCLPTKHFECAPRGVLKAIQYFDVFGGSRTVLLSVCQVQYTLFSWFAISVPTV